MACTVTLIPGDGIGPEVVEAAVRIIDASNADIEWESVVAGESAMAAHGTPLPEEVLDSIRRNRVALKGPLGTPIGHGFTSVNVGIRKALDLYANLRPALSTPGVKSRYKDVDIVVVRENTQDLYAGYESVVSPGVAVAMKIITRDASRRIARFAFEHCRHAGRRRVTAVHKASIMKLSDGLFLEMAREVASDYPFTSYDEIALDRLVMTLVDDPHAFDVLLLPNLSGDIVSDICAGLVGGLGLLPGANIGVHSAVFEAVHGTAPDIAGKGIANPMAVVNSSMLMLDHIGERTEAKRIRAATGKVLLEGHRVTADLGGTASTLEFADAVIEAMATLEMEE